MSVVNSPVRLSSGSFDGGALSWARNGVRASGPRMGSIGQAIASISGRRKKDLFTDSVPPLSSSYVTGSSTVLHRSLFRTGPSTKGVRCDFGVVKSRGAQGDVPLVTLALTLDVTGSTVSSSVSLVSESFTGSLGLDDVEQRVLYIDVSSSHDYAMELSVADGARVCDVSIVEADQPALYGGQVGGLFDGECVVTTGMSVGERVDEDDAHRILSGTTALWNDSGKPFFSSKLATANPDSSYKNVLDETQTAWASGSRGWWAFPKSMGSLGDDHVPCVLGAYCKVDAGSGGYVALIQEGATITEMKVANTSYAWVTTTCFLSSSDDARKLDVHIKGDGTNRLRISAVCLFSKGA